MDFALEKYYPMIIRTFTFIILMTIFSLIVLYAANLLSSKQGEVLLKLGIVFTLQGFATLLIIIFFQKYATYAVSTYPLTSFILFTYLCTYDDTLTINEWSMGFVGTVFSRSSTCK